MIFELYIVKEEERKLLTIGILEKIRKIHEKNLMDMQIVMSKDNELVALIAEPMLQIVDRVED